MQESGEALGVWTYVAAGKLAISGTMNGILATSAVVVMMPEACNFGLGDNYIFLIVVVVFVAGG